MLSNFLSLCCWHAPSLPPLDQWGVTHTAKQVGLRLQLWVLTSHMTQCGGLINNWAFGVCRNTWLKCLIFNMCYTIFLFHFCETKQKNKSRLYVKNEVSKQSMSWLHVFERKRNIIENKNQPGKGLLTTVSCVVSAISSIWWRSTYSPHRVIPLQRRESIVPDT